MPSEKIRAEAWDGFPMRGTPKALLVLLMLLLLEEKKQQRSNDKRVALLAAFQWNDRDFKGHAVLLLLLPLLEIGVAFGAFYRSSDFSMISMRGVADDCRFERLSALGVRSNDLRLSRQASRP